MQTDIAIVGGGLAGLALADHLHRAGQDFALIEARARLGGRIKTHQGIDLGPSWFWPGQPRMAAMAQRFGLQVFEQYAQGEISFEDAQGKVQRGVGFSSMEGSYRIGGGMQALVDALADELPPQRVLTGNAVTKIARSGLTLTMADAAQITAKHVVLAVPPRIAGQMTYDPPLADRQMQALNDTPTWMGGQAKIVATYQTAFWRDAGLSGDAMSRFGPMHEIHDATAMDGTPAALFGFVGVPIDHRAGNEAALLEAAKAQLARMFGAQAANPETITLQDWAFEPETATTADHAPMTHHPAYTLPMELSNIWEGTLLMGSTEVAPQFGGYLEGALSVAEHLAGQLTTA